MATLNINGKRVKVDDSFLSLTPEQQNATVDEIAASMGGGPAAAPEGLKPGSKEYALWARDQAIAGKTLPQISEAPKEWAPPTAADNYQYALDKVAERYYPTADKANIAKEYAPYDAGKLFQSAGLMGFGDEVGGAGQALGNFLAGRTGDFGQAFGDFSELERARAELGREQQGLLGTASEVGGALLSGRPDMAAAALPKTILGSAVQGAKASVLPGAIYGAGSAEGDLGERAMGAATGATMGMTTGAALGAAGSKVADLLTKGAQNSATSAAIKGAPVVDDLRAAASNLFETSKASGTAFTPQKFTTFAADLVRKAQAKGIDPDLDGEALLIYRRMAELANKGRQTGQGVSLGELHNLRQKAQDVALSATKNRTKGMAQDIVSGLDNLLENVKPTDVIGGTQAAGDMLEGISLWSRAKKMALVEEVITKAQYAGSGFENGLRLGFKGLLRNPNTRKLFTKAELQEIERVGNGTVGANLLRILGKFGFSSSGNGLGGFLGGTAGFTLGGPIGAAATAVGASAARKGAEVLTRNAATRATKVLATPNIPNIGQKALPPGTAGALSSAALPWLPSTP